MEDSKIVELYFLRDETALACTAEKYEGYSFRIAYQILEDREDAAECVNESYLALWNSIPPQKPENLGTYLGKITRRISLKRWRDSRAGKRGGGQTALALEELSGCIPGGTDPEALVEVRELAGSLDSFLRTLPDRERQVFVLRYWHMRSIRQIGSQLGYSESKVKSMLLRTREKLRTKWIKEGYLIGR